MVQDLSIQIVIFYGIISVYNSQVGVRGAAAEYHGRGPATGPACSEDEEIPPGENWMFSIELVAPPASFINNFDSFNLPLFKLEWSMIQEDVNWFSNRLIRNIAITCPEEEEE